MLRTDTRLLHALCRLSGLQSLRVGARSDMVQGDCRVEALPEGVEAFGVAAKRRGDNHVLMAHDAYAAAVERLPMLEDVTLTHCPVTVVLLMPCDVKPMHNQQHEPSTGGRVAPCNSHIAC